MTAVRRLPTPKLHPGRNTTTYPCSPPPHYRITVGRLKDAYGPTARPGLRPVLDPPGRSTGMAATGKQGTKGQAATALACSLACSKAVQIVLTNRSARPPGALASAVVRLWWPPEVVSLGHGHNGAGGDVVVAAAEILHNCMTGGEDPR